MGKSVSIDKEEFGSISFESQKASGSHYTPPELAKFVASQITQNIGIPYKNKLRILDPAAGDGELLISLIQHLQNIGYKNIDVHALDINIKALEKAQKRLSSEFPNLNLQFQKVDFLEYTLKYFDKVTTLQKQLFDSPSYEQFDVVIANPPYVRTQVMGASASQQIAAQFGLSGRVDLYHAFINAIAMTLKPNGILGIIVSNRFMTTKAGASIRADIRRNFEISHIWDLGDTKIFEAAVLPAVLLLKRKLSYSQTGEERFTSIYSHNNVSESSNNYSTIFEALNYDGSVTVNRDKEFQVTQGILSSSHNQDDIWRVSTNKADTFLDKIAQSAWGLFSDIGKIKVGVKTTADSVFIRKDWEKLFKDNLPELLRPLITHHVASRYKAQTIEHSLNILYPHEVIDGKRKAVNLNFYPNSKQYLESHKEVLSQRSYVREAGREWFEIWVPHDPESWKHPKLVWRDISAKPMFWIDKTGAVVNGDCYWMICNNGEDENLLWLMAAVGNSSFIEKFYDYKFNNKLYAGRRRYMTQYVENFPLPDPNTITARKIIDIAQAAHSARDEAEIKSLDKELDSLVWKSFDLSIEKI